MEDRERKGRGEEEERVTAFTPFQPFDLAEAWLRHLKETSPPSDNQEQLEDPVQCPSNCPSFPCSCKLALVSAMFVLSPIISRSREEGKQKRRKARDRNIYAARRTPFSRTYAILSPRGTRSPIHLLSLSCFVWPQGLSFLACSVFPFLTNWQSRRTSRTTEA